MSRLPELVYRFLRAHRLARRDQSILVAVSGGLDSMVLLHILNRLRQQHGWRLAVAHFNHQLRGRESDLDEQFVRRTAVHMGLPLVKDRADVAAYTRQTGLSVEMAARKLRHDFLARAARRIRARVVALAHHADDQVELFFLRLLRGAGGEGLAGMKSRSPSSSDRRVDLVRPLIEQPKAALRAYAREHGIRFREDATNALVTIKRNRIRHQLLPLLARQYEPAVREAIQRTMRLVEAESNFVRDAAEDWLRSELHRPFARLHSAVRRQVIRIQLIRMGVVPTFESVEKLCNRAQCVVSIGPGGLFRRDPEGWVERVEGGALEFRHEERGVDLAKSGRRIRFGELEIQWSLIRARAVRGKPSFKSGVEYFDADRVGTSVLLRHWQPGDRFQPIGMRSPVKLQDLFTNGRIPLARRRTLVIGVTARGEVFWVEGLRIGERFKLDKGTGTRLKWQWRRGESRVARSGSTC